MLQKYLRAIKSSFTDLYKHPVVFAGIAGLLLIFFIGIRIFHGWGMVSGLIIGLLQILALTFYFNWLILSRAPRKIKLKDLTEFNYSLFIAVLNVAFALFITDIILRTLKDSPLAGLAIGINLIVVVCFNVLPEVINKHQYQGLTSFTESLDFIKRRWVEWILPMTLPIIPLLIFTPKQALVQYALGDPLMPFMNAIGNLRLFANSSGSIFLLILLVIFAHWLMLFRRRLYDQLS